MKDIEDSIELTVFAKPMISLKYNNSNTHSYFSKHRTWPLSDRIMFLKTAFIKRSNTNEDCELLHLSSTSIQPVSKTTKIFPQKKITSKGFQLQKSSKRVTHFAKMNPHNTSNKDLSRQKMAKIKQKQKIKKQSQRTQPEKQQTNR